MTATTKITPQRLRDAAASARELSELLDQCLREQVFFLIGFDLDYLAARFDAAAEVL